MDKNGQWLKAAESSNNGGACVEWRRLPDGTIEVANTRQNGQGPTLSFTPAEWDAFTTGMVTGDWVPSRP